MYLSKIEIFGFKSFASKTKLIFNDGITGIVGPNGCGKTNIVDALRWVLGEQRYTTLRSDKMEDVIFNGTKYRKPIGLAEVSLTIQNTKGILPMEYSDVTITRRLFRSGESEYLLNKTSCRLKDIVSLFMDTGMGANAYSVIELKMVESILSDRTDERRHLFEEAAGVTKYKTKRKEAYRRLEDVQNDLMRVNDIISEVEKTVSSLERQAKKAEKYNDYLSRLRILEIDVSERDYSSLVNRLNPLMKRQEESQIEKNNILLQLKHHEIFLEDIQTEYNEIELELESVRTRHTELTKSIYESEQNLRFDMERKLSLEQKIEQQSLFNKERNKKIETGQVQLINLENTKNLLSAEFELLQIQIQEHSSSHSLHENNLSENKLSIAALQSKQMNLLEEIAEKKISLRDVDSTLISILDQKRKFDDGIHEKTKLLEKAIDVSNSKSFGEIQLKDNVLQAEQTFHEMEKRKGELKIEIETLQNKAFEIQNQIGEKMTKIDFLNGLVERLAGYSESVQYLLSHHDWSTSTAVTIADTVNTRSDLRVCIESSLGDAAHYLIVHDIAEAISGIEHLKKSDKGKATFVCLSRIPFQTTVPFPIMGNGIIGWAIDLIEYDEKYKNLFKYIFKNVLIVKDAYTANLCIREYPSIKCVTMGGDIFESHGFVRGGVHRQDEGGLIGKKEQIRDHTEDVNKLKFLLEENQSALEARNNEYNKIDLPFYADEIKKSQQELTSLEKECAQVIFERENHEREIEKLKNQIINFNEDISRLENKKYLLIPGIDDLILQLQVLENNIKDEMEVLISFEKSYSESSMKLQELYISSVQRSSDLKNIENEIARVNTMIGEASSVIETTVSEILESQNNIEILLLAIADIENTLITLRAEKVQVDQSLEILERKQSEKKDEIVRIEHSLKCEREDHDEAVNIFHEIELKVSEIKQRIETLKMYAKENMDIELENKHFEEEDVFDLALAKEDIHYLKSKIQTLGPVNQLAYEEYQEEKKRFDFLSFQRDDLLDAEKTLHSTIDEISVTAQEKFLTTFELIRQNFISIFKSLFEEGDEADLKLEANSDLLEAAIDIIAKPRGKRPHSIELLSGGEKTLTAIALLFAIYLVKPSPFCILDEVDAPLDDANIDRFIRIIRKFSENTQFIIVTHNKRTMEAADTLYGVTMEEEGVSKLVSVAFDNIGISEYSKN